MCQIYFDNDATSKIDDVLTEHGGLLHVLSLSTFNFFDRLVGTLCLKQMVDF